MTIQNVNHAPNNVDKTTGFNALPLELRAHIFNIAIAEGRIVPAIIASLASRSMRESFNHANTLGKEKGLAEIRDHAEKIQQITETSLRSNPYSDNSSTFMDIRRAVNGQLSLPQSKDAKTQEQYSDQIEIMKQSKFEMVKMIAQKLPTDYRDYVGSDQILSNSLYISTQIDRIRDINSKSLKDHRAEIDKDLKECAEIESTSSETQILGKDDFTQILEDEYKKIELNHDSSKHPAQLFPIKEIKALSTQE